MSAIAALIGGAISAGSALLGTHMKNEAQKRESELAYLRERAAIREQNSYNSASAQIARLQAAGLNPNLMYDQPSDAAAGLQSDIAHYQPAELDNAVAPMGSAGSEMIQSMIGLKDMENKTMLAESQVLLNASTEGVNWSQVELNETQAYNMLEMLGLKRTEVDQMVKESQSRIQVNEANYEALKAQADRDLQLIKESIERVKQIQAETHFTETQDLIAAALLPYQIKNLQAQSYQATQLGLEAYERARVVMAYYHLADKTYDLDFDKFDFEQRKFDDTLNFNAEQNKRDRILGYANLGIQAAGLVTSVAMSGRGPLGMLSPSPWVGMGSYGAGRTTFGSTRNSPSPIRPYEPNGSKLPRSKR